MDKIIIRNLEVFAYHGVLPEENVLGQRFLISATLFLDVRSAGIGDDIKKTVDYAGVCFSIKSFVEENRFKLIESVAERLAEKLLSDYPILHCIRLEIKKPWAPIAVPFEMVSVEIERSRDTYR